MKEKSHSPPFKKKKEAAIIHPGEAQDWQLFALPTAKLCHAYPAQ